MHALIVGSLELCRSVNMVPILWIKMKCHEGLHDMIEVTELGTSLDPDSVFLDLGSHHLLGLMPCTRDANAISRLSSRNTRMSDDSVDFPLLHCHVLVNKRFNSQVRWENRCMLYNAY